VAWSWKNIIPRCDSLRRSLAIKLKTMIFICIIIREVYENQKKVNKAQMSFEFV
jgi:hypothetical protein